MGFHATTESLDQSAAKVDRQADAVAAANLAGPADRVAAAMPWRRHRRAGAGGRGLVADHVVRLGR